MALTFHSTDHALVMATRKAFVAALKGSHASQIKSAPTKMTPLPLYISEAAARTSRSNHRLVQTSACVRNSGVCGRQ